MSFLACRGLGIETIFLNLLKVYCDPGNLVIVVGTSSKEEEFYVAQLEAEGVKPLPKIITTAYAASDRYDNLPHYFLTLNLFQREHFSTEATFLNFACVSV